MTNASPGFSFEPRRIEATIRKIARDDLSVFVQTAYRILYDDQLMRNWHLDAIAHQLECMVRGDVRRLIITMPPRTMKSFIASICLPAWLLGKDPKAKIICASYGHDLSKEFGALTLKLMRSDWYRRVFPQTHIDAKRASSDRVNITCGGYRHATSVGGTLTGRGGDYIIIDDPMKAADGHSETVRESCSQWFKSTVLSRLNNPKKGRILIVAQRLHKEDLPGQLLDQGGWKELSLPLVAWQDQDIELKHNLYLERFAGEILHDERFGEEEVANLRFQMGERDFEAQYNQRPLPPGGALFKLEWLSRYDVRPSASKVQAIIQSWDTAYDIEDRHDYSVCATWVVSGSNHYLLDVYRDRLEFYALEKAVYTQRDKWKADLVVVEKAGSGISLLQNIRRDPANKWLQPKEPIGSKQDRASQQTPKFEWGEIWVPKDAPWLKIFEEELGRFPYGKHDDQVDSVTQFLAAADTGRLLHYVDLARRR